MERRDRVLIGVWVLEVVDPSVTHKRIDVKEDIQEQGVNHGVTTNAAISAEEFEKKLGSEKK